MTTSYYGLVPAIVLWCYVTKPQFLLSDEMCFWAFLGCFEGFSGEYEGIADQVQLQGIFVYLAKSVIQIVDDLEIFVLTSFVFVRCFV